MGWGTDKEEEEEPRKEEGHTTICLPYRPTTICLHHYHFHGGRRNRSGCLGYSLSFLFVPAIFWSHSPACHCHTYTLVVCGATCLLFFLPHSHCYMHATVLCPSSALHACLSTTPLGEGQGGLEKGGGGLSLCPLHACHHPCHLPACPCLCLSTCHHHTIPLPYHHFLPCYLPYLYLHISCPRAFTTHTHTYAALLYHLFPCLCLCLPATMPFLPLPYHSLPCHDLLSLPPFSIFPSYFRAATFCAFIVPCIPSVLRNKEDGREGDSTAMIPAFCCHASLYAPSFLLPAMPPATLPTSAFLPVHTAPFMPVCLPCLPHCLQCHLTCILLTCHPPQLLPAPHIYLHTCISPPVPCVITLLLHMPAPFACLTHTCLHALPPALFTILPSRVGLSPSVPSSILYIFFACLPVHAFPHIPLPLLPMPYYHYHGRDRKEGERTKD